ncbi:unnamed protein product [Chrysoparadoxa australica]
MEIRKDFKRDFLLALRLRVTQMCAAKRSVILCGDLNACVGPEDTAYDLTEEACSKSDWCIWIRSMVGRKIARGGDNDDTTDEGELPPLKDCFRQFHPDVKDAYTCWSTQTGAREHNYGTRIDYILCDPELQCKGCDIRPAVQGSDHCPVVATFILTKDEASDEGATKEAAPHPALCSCHYVRFRGTQAKLTSHFTKADDQGKSVLTV